MLKYLNCDHYYRLEHPSCLNFNIRLYFWHLSNHDGFVYTIQKSKEYFYLSLDSKCLVLTTWQIIGRQIMNNSIWQRFTNVAWVSLSQQILGEGGYIINVQIYNIGYLSKLGLFHWDVIMCILFEPYGQWFRVTKTFKTKSKVILLFNKILIGSIRNNSKNSQYLHPFH